MSSVHKVGILVGDVGCYLKDEITFWLRRTMQFDLRAASWCQRARRHALFTCAARIHSTSAALRISGNSSAVYRPAAGFSASIFIHPSSSSEASLKLLKRGSLPLG